MRARDLAWGALATALLWSPSADAKDPGRRGPPPPAEAVSACSAQPEGAACSFTHDGEQVTGTCRTGPEGLPAACFPARGPRGPHRAPPPEAIQACSGLKEGEACAVTLDGNTLDGTCRGGPGGEPPACMPPRPPPPPPR